MRMSRRLGGSERGAYLWYQYSYTGGAAREIIYTVRTEDGYDQYTDDLTQLDSFPYLYRRHGVAWQTSDPTDLRLTFNLNTPATDNSAPVWSLLSYTSIQSQLYRGVEGKVWLNVPVFVTPNNVTYQYSRYSCVWVADMVQHNPTKQRLLGAVYSDNEDEYPADGIQGDFWYVKQT